MEASQQPPVQGWPKLTTKLKLKVLRYLLVLVPHDIHDDIDKHNHPDFLRDHLYPLIAVRNRELADLAQEVYYGDNVFHLDINSTGHELYMSVPNTKVAHLARHIWTYVEPCTIPQSLDDTLFRKKDEWCGLLSYKDGYDDVELARKEKAAEEARIAAETTGSDLFPAETRNDSRKRVENDDGSMMTDGDSSTDTDDDEAKDTDDDEATEEHLKRNRGEVMGTRTGWQDHFTTLDDVQIIIGLYVSARDAAKTPSQHCCYDPEALERLKTFLGRTRMGLRAKRVKTKFDITSGRRHCTKHKDLLDRLRLFATKKG